MGNFFSHLHHCRWHKYSPKLIKQPKHFTETLTDTALLYSLLLKIFPSNRLKIGAGTMNTFRESSPCCFSRKGLKSSCSSKGWERGSARASNRSARRPAHQWEGGGTKRRLLSSVTPYSINSRRRRLEQTPPTLGYCRAHQRDTVTLLRLFRLSVRSIPKESKSLSFSWHLTHPRKCEEAKNLPNCLTLLWY